MNSNANGMFRQAQTITTLIASVLILLWTVGCTSAPSVTPEKFVLDFIQKHIPMIDKSVADFYVKDEQTGILDRVEKFVASNKVQGMSASLNAATYNFSKIKVDVLDQKEDYIDDEAVNFLKVSVSGNYTKTSNEKSTVLVEDEIIILKSVEGKWKVTEKINPWKS